jgi:arsenate reductase
MSKSRSQGKRQLLEPLQQTAQRLIEEFEEIPDGRKQRLMELSGFIDGNVRDGRTIRLIFICTHNSRRSHMAQLWAAAAACYYGVDDVQFFSGGTEATAFDERAVKAMQGAGFEIRQTSKERNADFDVRFSHDAPVVKVFSKKYDDPVNPAGDFAAVMTCSHADKSCPLVAGASKRIAIPYGDPKDFDGTPQEETAYRNCVSQIGREMLFVFSQCFA